MSGLNLAECVTVANVVLMIVNVVGISCAMRFPGWKAEACLWAGVLAFTIAVAS